MGVKKHRGRSLALTASQKTHNAGRKFPARARRLLADGSRWPVSAPSSELVFFRRHQDFTLSGMVGGTDNAFLLHSLDDGSGPVVADAEAALDVAGRRLPVAQHHGHRLVVGIV